MLGWGETSLRAALLLCSSPNTGGSWYLSCPTLRSTAGLIDCFTPWKLQRASTVWKQIENACKGSRQATAGRSLWTGWLMAALCLLPFIWSVCCCMQSGCCSWTWRTPQASSGSQHPSTWSSRCNKTWLLKWSEQLNNSENEVFWRPVWCYGVMLALRTLTPAIWVQVSVEPEASLLRDLRIILLPIIIISTHCFSPHIWCLSGNFLCYCIMLFYALVTYYVCSWLDVIMHNIVCLDVTLAKQRSISFHA